MINRCRMRLKHSLANLLLQEETGEIDETSSVRITLGEFTSRTTP
jgi:hypothetical protein